jgi:hypothetical protein
VAKPRIRAAAVIRIPLQANPAMPGRPQQPGAGAPKRRHCRVSSREGRVKTAPGTMSSPPFASDAAAIRARQLNWELDPSGTCR